jgi:hypothetical protein
MNEERHLRMALTAKQQRLASRLAKMDEDDASEDAEFAALDESKPMAAFSVMLLASLLREATA